MESSGSWWFLADRHWVVTQEQRGGVETLINLLSQRWRQITLLSMYRDHFLAFTFCKFIEVTSS